MKIHAGGLELDAVDCTLTDYCGHTILKVMFFSSGAYTAAECNVEEHRKQTFANTRLHLVKS